MDERTNGRGFLSEPLSISGTAVVDDTLELLLLRTAVVNRSLPHRLLAAIRSLVEDIDRLDFAAERNSSG